MMTRVLQLGILFITYFLTGKLGLSFNAVGGFATFFWLPTGISIAALLIAGYSLWPAIFLGAFFVNFTNGASPLIAAGIALGNTLEAVVATVLLKKILRFRLSLERIHDLLGLTIVAVPLATFLSATIGVTSLYWGNVIERQDISATWIAWWVGDLLSGMLVVPFLLIWSTHFAFKKIQPLRIIEGILVTILLIICCGIVFLTEQITYFIFPPLIWIALRFSPRETVTAIAAISLLAILNTTVYHFGPFVKPNISDSLLYLQTFMGTVGLTSLILSVAVTEYKNLERRKDDFISIASHELKTPITSISLFLQLLRRHIRQQKDEQATDLIEKAHKQMKKMNNLIDDLLDVSKIQSGKLVLKKEKIAIDELIQDIADSMQRIHKTYNIEIEGQIKKRLLIDRERISQVVINLLNNAIKYSPKGNKIVISLRSTKQEAIVSITDFGIGIAKEDQEKIFERFFRVSGPDETTYPGFGIGLYVASEIIRRHKGMLWVKSGKGKGSTFSFSLPLPVKRQRIRSLPKSFLRA